MLTGIEVAFLGGDARHLEMIRTLADLDASITLFGYDSWQNSFSGVKKSAFYPESLAKIDALILPAAGIDDSGKVEAAFSAQEYILSDEHVSRMPAHAKIYTGIARPRLKELCEKHKIGLVELFERDDIAIYNSIPTAEGTIMLAIQHTDFTIHGSCCVVLGFGRTGMTLARTLQGMGAKVKVGVRRSSHFARVWEMGMQPFYTTELAEQAGDADMLFNTIPAPVVSAKVIANMPPHALIIDLASKPGGTDFQYAEKRGIQAILAPGLPGIVAPKSAGKIMARGLVALLEEEAMKRGD